MTFFESLLALLAAAILLLQVSRRLAIPYPAMLAVAGVCLALIPGAPKITLEPHTALALFIAPALVNAAFDFPAGAVWRLWRPLFALAVVAVILSASAVAWLGMAMAGLPFFAALALGAIVAPPDAAAATAILGSVRMPRRSVEVLEGESLLNDASALLLFGVAVLAQTHGGIDAPVALRIGLAVPGGVIAGILFGRLYRHIVPIVTGTLGGNLLEFVTSFGVWIVAERMGLSPVLCLVAFSMTIARFAGHMVRPRMRIHSFAVWETAVFLLNVLAFLLMGFQMRSIVGGQSPAQLREAAWFALAVIACLIVVRMAWVLIYGRLAHQFPVLRGSFNPGSLRQGILVGWCGMRGLVTLATALSLPESFPRRELIVLTAFAVVLATLVVQGLTLAPLVRLLGLDGEDNLPAELAQARADLARAALATLEGKTGPAADRWRYEFESARDGAGLPGNLASVDEARELGRAAFRRQRERLEELRREQGIGPDVYIALQEELDFDEIALSGEEDRRIVES